MVRISRYGRQHLKGSRTEDAILAMLSKQSEPHGYEQGRHEGSCCHCGLGAGAQVHTGTDTEGATDDGRC